MNLITGGLGSALFSLPWSVAGSSIIPAIAIVALVLMLNAWTITILIRAADNLQVFDIGSLISRLPGGVGRPLGALTNVFVWLSSFLCLVSYIIVIYDSAEQLLPPNPLGLNLHDHEQERFVSRIVCVAIASLCILPLCFFSQRLLEKTSALAIAVNIYLFVLVGVFYGQAASRDELPVGCCLIGKAPKGSFAMVTIMFQAVLVQLCILPMYKELENRSPQKMNRIVAVAFTVLFILFCGFSVLSYLLIGPKVGSDILSNLPPNTWSNIAQVGTMLIVACVYPIMVFPMIAPLLSGEGLLLGIRRDIVASVTKILIVIAAMLISTFVDSLGIVNEVNGAMSAAIFVAVIPSVIGLAFLSPGCGFKLALALLAVCGVGVACMGFVFTDNYVSELACVIPV